ncbi:MAG: S41 family peptidase, partial [Candidatus Nealsonbacteria bacterium]
SMAKKGLVIFSFLVMMAAVFGAGFYFGQDQQPILPPEGILNAELGKPQGLDFSLFWEAWRTLEENFVDNSKMDYQKMIYGAVSGMTSSLKDPYTVYMPPEDAKIFKEDVSGEFTGVGMEIGIRNGELTVIAPLEGTPAQQAGLMAGDKIVKIDDTFTADLTTDEAVKLIRGEKGTKVVLTIFREDWLQAKDFEIIRDVIEVPSLKLTMKEGNIAYINLYQFSEIATGAFNKTAAEILASPADRIILDLRNNPGGYLEVAQDIAGWFLKKGELVTIEDFGGSIENEEYRSLGSGRLSSYPLVILINKGSASASEILAGALRDNRNIQLIGTQSFGKGSVQTLKELKKGSLKVTVAKWLTPKGTLIDKEGLKPDIEIELTEKDIDAGKDPQLEKAIEIIKEIR